MHTCQNTSYLDTDATIWGFLQGERQVLHFLLDEGILKVTAKQPLQIEDGII